VKILGPTQKDALRSLAAKLRMIEQAQHTVDLAYYIYKSDLVGYAILGALCDAVKRGVDVRIMVDSLGSIHSTRSHLRALETCAEQAGFVRNATGHPTPYRARAQVVIFNALTNLRSSANRRSHDKLLIVDGNFPDKGMVMTGGRNISLDYYGIQKDGSPDPDVYRDSEILLRSTTPLDNDTPSVGQVSSVYYTLLFLHRGNKRIHPVVADGDDDREDRDLYRDHRDKAQQSLDFIKKLPAMTKAFAGMPHYLTEGFHDAKVRLAHELGNLVRRDVETKAWENTTVNVNSIEILLSSAIEESEKVGPLTSTLRIVSPYLFLAAYTDEKGNVVFDGAKEVHRLMEEHPEFRLEIITNSVLTSDNFFTQSVIDMDMAPRLLLTPELRETWLSSDLDKGEFNPALVESTEWQRLINNPRIAIYQTGRGDSVLLGGSTHYGKLHAKFLFDDEFGFVGSSNFDYRSRLYNNEMGFFYLSREVSQDLARDFETLKSISYRWGSSKWLEMRKAVMATGTSKARTTRTQRELYKILRSTGLKRQF